jgi:hypothetical protein
MSQFGAACSRVCVPFTLRFNLTLVEHGRPMSEARPMKRRHVIALAIALGGCAGAPHPTPPSAVRAPAESRFESCERIVHRALDADTDAALACADLIGLWH